MTKECRETVLPDVQHARSQTKAVVPC